MRSQVVELASDQYGSRFIQQRLESATDDEKQVAAAHLLFCALFSLACIVQAAFQQLLPETYALCKDVFGNYVVQKFLDAGLPEQRNVLIQELLGNVLDLSLQMYGCRVIQKAISVADARQQGLLVRELMGHVMQCVKDQNGNHVIQKCIEKGTFSRARAWRAASNVPVPRCCSSVASDPVHRRLLRQPGVPTLHAPVWLPCHSASTRALPEGAAGACACPHRER